MEKNIYDKMVKRTVLYSFSLWLTLLILAGAWGYYAYADFKEIGVMKSELSTKIQDLQSLEKVGVSFSDFKKADKKGITEDKNLQNIVQIMEKEFYDEHFQNTSKENYEQFIKKKTKEIEERLDGNEHLGMKNISSTVLPSFSDYGFDFDQNEDYSELHFVNYVERIMQTFNLEYTGDIGIADVLPVVDESQDNAQKTKGKNVQVSDEELLANKIFYIPLSFTIEGSKSSIIDFIYFVENVGRVNVETQNLAIHVDDFFRKGEDNYRDSDLVLDGEINKGDYNIYLNQLIDIESISFSEFIYNKKDGDKRGEFISNIRKKPQGLEKYEADVTLRFYVKGVSDYKLQKKYEQVVAGIISRKKDILKSQNILSSLKSYQKTPEVALLLKKFVTYSSAINELEINFKKYKTLKEDEKYADILKAIELEKLIENDLDAVTIISKQNLQDTQEASKTEEKEDISNNIKYEI